MASSMLSTTVTKTPTATASAISTKVPPQGGVLEGVNPVVYSPSNPIIFFIIIFCRLLHWLLSLLRQPRVIAEAIGGILLGPSAMGHVPGFTAAIFPSAAMPNLTFVANLGLIRNGWIGSGFAVTGASASAQTSRKPRSYPTSAMQYSSPR